MTLQINNIEETDDAEYLCEVVVGVNNKIKDKVDLRPGSKTGIKVMERLPKTRITKKSGIPVIMVFLKWHIRPDILKTRKGQDRRHKGYAPMLVSIVKLDGRKHKSPSLLYILATVPFPKFPFSSLVLG